MKTNEKVFFPWAKPQLEAYIQDNKDKVISIIRSVYKYDKTKYTTKVILKSEK